MASGWSPTHWTPASGSPAWSMPDPSAAQAPSLAPDLPVMVVGEQPHGWVLVECDNGWETWVDGRLLVPMTPVSPTVWPAVPFAGEGEPRPSRSLATTMVPIGLVVILLFTGAAQFVLRRVDPGNVGVVRALSLAGIGGAMVLFLFSLIGRNRPQRARPELDVIRAAISIGVVYVMGRAAGVEIGLLVLGSSVAVGAVAGVLEAGSVPTMRGSDGKRYARAPVLPTIVTFAGLLVGLMAAMGSLGRVVQAGQLVGAVGAGLMLGVGLRRAVPTAATKAATSMAAVWIAMALVALPALLAASTLEAWAQSELDGAYRGSFDTQPDPTSAITANDVSLELKDGKLSGSMVLASKQTFPPPDEPTGQIPVCFIMAATLSGSELSGTERDDGTWSFSGSVPVSADLRAFTTPQEQASDACTSVQQGVGLGDTMLSVTISDAGADGSLAGLNLEGLGTTEAIAFRATRNGGPPESKPSGTNPPGTDPEPATGADPSGGASTTTSAPSSTGRPPPPPTTFLNAPGEPISPRDATDAAISVITGLLGAGAITAAQADAARRAIENGAVPADVIADLGRGGALDKLGVSGAIAGIPTSDGLLQQATAALNDPHSNKTLTADQFREYLKQIERWFPDATWKQITAALHASEYSADIGGKLPGTDIPLFQQGQDTAGWENILPYLYANQGRSGDNGSAVANFIPKFVIDKSGNKVDIMHAMAGLRSDLNRPPAMLEDLFKMSGIEPPYGRNFMRWANTHGGDSWQEVIHAPGSSWGRGELRWASEFAPPDQRLGNDVGMWLSDFYRKPANGNVPLSKAYDIFFRQTGGASTGRTSYVHQ